MAIQWPYTVLCPARIVPPFLQNRTVAGGASLSGNMQVSASDAGIWVCAFENIVLHNRATVLSWRSIAVKAEGRLNPIDVALFDYEREYGAHDAAYDGPQTGVPFSDGEYFSDGVGFIGSTVSVVASAAAALRAVSISVTVTIAPRIESGQFFSINHPAKGPRWYQITTTTPRPTQSNLGRRCVKLFRLDQP